MDIPSNASDAANKPFHRLAHFGGFDWASQAHHFVLVDAGGKILLNFSFSDDAAGWKQLREKLSAHERLGVAIETRCGPAVERLLDLGVMVYPINPKAAERYRNRKAPSGVKSDPLDAWCFADALRTDGQGWRELKPLDPLTAELRILCRDEMGLIEQRTALVLQLKAALHEYYPTALEAFDDWTVPGAWHFVLSFPTPEILLKRGRRKWENFLHAHKLYRPATAEKRLELFAGANEFANPNAAVTRAKSLLAVTVVKQLDALELQLQEYRRRITELFGNHPDHDCFGSLPGAGPKIAPRLLGELGNDRTVFESHESLQLYAGTAPVTRTSGKQSFTRMRRACNKILRTTVHHWADLSRAACPWAQAYYQEKKNQGKNHASALRCLGQRWLKILWKMWQTGTPYNEAFHTRNQTRHGSWVIALKPQAAPSA